MAVPRPGRNGEAVAHWVYKQATRRTDAEFELVDLLDYKLPLLDEAYCHCSLSRLHQVRQKRPSTGFRQRPERAEGPLPGLPGECHRQREPLTHALLLGEFHARDVRAASQVHRSKHRPHQGRTQLRPNTQEHHAVAHHLSSRRLLHAWILCGLINECK